MNYNKSILQYHVSGSYEEQPGFGLTVVISICLHIVFLALVFLFAKDSPSKKFITPIYTVDLFEPEKPMTPAKIIEPISQGAGESKKQRVKEEKVIALKKEKEPSPALDRQGQALDEALKKIKERVKKREAEETISRAIEGLESKQMEKTLKELREKVGRRQVIVKPTRRKTEDATSMRQGGTVKRIEELEEKYGADLWEVIQPKWHYAGGIKQGEVVVIAVRIDKQGRLIESYIEQSSGNAMLEMSAVRAIEKAAPLFPPLPQELGKDFVEIGVCFPRCKK